MMDYEIKERFYLNQIQHCQSRLAFLLLFKIPGLSNTPTDNVPRASIFHDYKRQDPRRSTSRWEQKCILNISVSY